METPLERAPVRAAEAVRGGADTRVVGIGASAGGLDALERFFAAMPITSGLAFVVVQHLDPNRPDLLPELLQRVTQMTVAPVDEIVHPKPDHVYVITPGHDLTLDEGRLVPVEREATPGARLRIDVLFESLASDQNDCGIGVILSGTGTDGTIGLRAIRECGGLTLAQDPRSAEFDGMPRSAIDAGTVDIVAEADDLPRRILEVTSGTTPAHGRDDESVDEDGTATVLALVRDGGGPDFTSHKANSVRRRIERRMAVRQVEDVGQYAQLLRDDESEAGLLVKELLIGVTSFFRDPEVWDTIRTKVIPALFEAHPDGGALRAWVPGCSTGQEAYSLAMVFREALDEVDPAQRCSLKIFATDLDPDAVERARRGRYPKEIVEEVGARRLQRFFVDEENEYRIGPNVREMVVFAEHDVTDDPPFTKLDLVSCRNLLIYFAPELQAMVLARFHYALRQHGMLVLGSAETTTVADTLYVPFAGERHVFRRSEAAVVASAAELPRSTKPRPGAHRTRQVPSIGSLVNDVIVRDHSPAAVLTNREGDIVHVTSRTGDFLEPAIGTASLNVFSMARDDLGEPLLEAFQAALIDDEARVARGVPIATRLDGSQRVADVLVRPLHEPAQLDGLVLVVFEETEVVDALVHALPLGDDDALLAKVSAELQTCRQRARTLREDMQASREELTSANEELQSMNEELSTSREELQSTNEELRTINTELEAKVQQLSRTGDDMKNLLDSTELAILFLDRDLRVRRFTTRAVDIMRLQASDVGRPFTDLASDLDYPDLTEVASGVLASGSPVAREVTASGRRWVLVGAIPYRTQLGDIDGVVITFGDVTRTKELELQLRSLQADLETRFADQTIELDDARRLLDDQSGSDPT